MTGQYLTSKGNFCSCGTCGWRTHEYLVSCNRPWKFWKLSWRVWVCFPKINVITSKVFSSQRLFRIFIINYGWFNFYQYKNNDQNMHPRRCAKLALFWWNMDALHGGYEILRYFLDTRFNHKISVRTRCYMYIKLAISEANSLTDKNKHLTRIKL